MMDGEDLAVLLVLWSPALLKAAPWGRTFLKCWEAEWRVQGGDEEGAGGCRGGGRAVPGLAQGLSVDLSVGCAEG